MDSMKQFVTLKTLLGGLGVTLERWARRVSELEIDRKNKDALLSELVQEASNLHDTAAALKQLWEDSCQREALQQMQVKCLVQDQDEILLLREENARLRRNIKEQEKRIRQDERAELEHGVWQSQPDTELEPISDIEECPNCGGENLVRGAHEVCSCLYCGRKFHLRFD